MLLDCPECGHRVSDRATACPSCGFPVAEHVAACAQTEARRVELASREAIGEVDCAHCHARGFRTFETTVEGRTREVFEWCSICEHTGRVVLCRSVSGYYAVEARHLDAFLAGARELQPPTVVDLGTEPPSGHRYPRPGKRKTE